MASASKKDREEEQAPTPPQQGTGDDSGDDEEEGDCSRYETAGNHLESLQREQDLWKDSEEALAIQRWADSVLKKSEKKPTKKSAKKLAK